MNDITEEYDSRTSEGVRRQGVAKGACHELGILFEILQLEIPARDEGQLRDSIAFSTHNNFVA